MDSIPGAEFFEGDITEKKTQIHIPEFFKLSPVDVVRIYDTKWLSVY